MLRALESKENYKRLVSQICSRYGIDPDSEQSVINISGYLRPIDSRALASRFATIEQANEFIVTQYGETMKANTFSKADDLNRMHDYMIKLIRTPGDDSKNADVRYKNTFTPDRINREHLRRERLENDSALSAFIGADEQTKLNLVKYFNYESLFRDEHIIIDSRYQNTTNTDRSKIVFSLQPNLKSNRSGDQTTISQQGGINIGSSIKDIVQIEIGPFTIPYKPQFHNFYRKISLRIDEWTSNSYQAYENGSFHFVFTIDKVDNNLLYLEPIDRVFRFTKPVNYIDNFTLSFGAMLPKITFDNDRLSTSSIDYTSSDGVITFDTPHNLITGDLVYISGFSTPDPALDLAFIEDVNRASGHIVVKKNNYSIATNIDMTEIRRTESADSTIYPIDSFNQTIEVYFASKRIQIPMRIRYLIQSTPS